MRRRRTDALALAVVGLVGACAAKVAPPPPTACERYQQAVATARLVPATADDHATVTTYNTCGCPHDFDTTTAQAQLVAAVPDTCTKVACDTPCSAIPRR